MPLLLCVIGYVEVGLTLHTTSNSTSFLGRVLLPSRGFRFPLWTEVGGRETAGRERKKAEEGEGERGEEEETNSLLSEHTGVYTSFAIKGVNT